MNREQLRSFGVDSIRIDLMTYEWKDWLRQERRDFIMILQQDMSEFARG